jgi:hypothetical protein
MTRRWRPHIPVRRQIYIGCEGASEVGYAAVLQDLANAASLPVYLEIEELAPGAGDPLARLEMVVRRIDLQRGMRTTPSASFAFLDEDQAVRDPQRADRARRLALENRIVIIWQRPCFEAVLPRHLPDRATHRPPDTPRAIHALEREWPGYAKPLERAALARRLELDAVLRAATVEPELAALPRVLGLLAYPDTEQSGVLAAFEGPYG